MKRDGLSGATFLLALFLAGSLFLASGCTPRPPRKGGSPVRKSSEVLPPLKVGVAVGKAAIKLRSPRGGRVVWSGASDLLSAGEEATFTPGADGSIVLHRGERERVLAPEATFLPEGGSTFLLDGRPYGGTVDIFHDGAALIAINRIGMEEYLRGVVPWEIGFLGEEKIEAAKCQTVAARTYAWTRVRESRELWDLLADESDQVYRGLEKTSDVIDRAIEETAGVVAVYRGELIRAYYSSTCGGRTAPLEEVWFEREPAPYLRGVIDGPGRRFDPDRAFCRDSPRFLWNIEWSGHEEISSVVTNLAGETDRDPEELGDLLDVRVTGRGSSGRVLTTTFETSGGKIDVGGDRVRWVLRRPDDGGILRSSWFTIDAKRHDGVVTKLIAEGRGFGHGIGMCQWGAMGMAERGYHFSQILEHYYPGARLTQITGRLLRAESR